MFHQNVRIFLYDINGVFILNLLQILDGLSIIFFIDVV